jgi:hypothetical protein
VIRPIGQVRLLTPTTAPVRQSSGLTRWQETLRRSGCTWAAFSIFFSVGPINNNKERSRTRRDQAAHARLRTRYVSRFLFFPFFFFLTFLFFIFLLFIFSFILFVSYTSIFFSYTSIFFFFLVWFFSLFIFFIF